MKGKEGKKRGKKRGNKRRREEKKINEREKGDKRR